jgi:hypothetical protein
LKFGILRAGRRSVYDLPHGGARHITARRPQLDRVKRGVDQMSEKPSVTAVLALLISLGTAAFSLYQWTAAQEEKKITIAVDISKSFLLDNDAPRRIEILRRYVGGAQNISEVDKSSAISYLNLLELHLVSGQFRSDQQ